jgi:hypothetical protein
VNRQQLSVCRTTVSQKLLEEYEEKLINFWKVVILSKKKHGQVLSQIGHADRFQYGSI